MVAERGPRVRHSRYTDAPTAETPMNELLEPLTESELDELDYLLLDRFGEEGAAYDEEKDEGILGISELDGFMTAVASGPLALQPSEWLPAVWGDYEPEWSDPEHFEHIFTLMMRHMNGITEALRDTEYLFEPIFLEREEGGVQQLVVDDWCDGYMRGVALAGREWQSGGDELLDLLRPILLFATEDGAQVLAQMDDDERTAAQSLIPDVVQRIQAFWLARRH